MSCRHPKAPIFIATHTETTEERQHDVVKERWRPELKSRHSHCIKREAIFFFYLAELRLEIEHSSPVCLRLCSLAVALHAISKSCDSMEIEATFILDLLKLLVEVTSEAKTTKLKR